MKFLLDFKSLCKSLVVNFAIFAVWYVLEFQQFGTLQFDRQCDNVISFIYIIVIWYAFHKYDSFRNGTTKLLLSMNEDKENSEENKELN